MTERNSDYYRHVSRHLREISLAALPRTLAILDEDTDSSSTSAIVPTVQTQSSSKKIIPAAIEESAVGHRLDAEAPTISNVLGDKEFIKSPSLEVPLTPSIDALVPRLLSEHQTSAASRSAIPEMSFLETSKSPTPVIKNESMKESSGGSAIFTDDPGRVLRRKRNRAEDRNDGNSQPLPSSQTSRLGQTPTGSLALVCPFFKRDPVEHGSRCLQRMGSIAHIKHHIARIHTPKFYCERCLVVLSDHDSHQAHITHGDCTRDPSTRLNGVSYQQRERINLRPDRQLSLQGQWFAIWDILFPGVTKPASIYIDMDKYGGLLKKHYDPTMLFSQFLSALARRPPTSLAEMESILNEAISQDDHMLFDKLRLYIDRGTRPTLVEAPESQAPEGHLVDNSTVSKSQELFSEPQGHDFLDAEREADFQDSTPLPNMTTPTPVVTGDFQLGSSIHTIGYDGNHEERAGYGGAHSVDTLLDFSRGLGDDFELDKSPFDDLFGEPDK